MTEPAAIHLPPAEAPRVPEVRRECDVLPPAGTGSAVALHALLERLGLVGPVPQTRDQRRTAA
ncbi:hypothetical protein [Kribbella sp.]|uniref:hypothetical protein n=1 Tax=Kribbella sp. TaxID=1871183 RepID=UPI002D75C385|nr:hypothetical protein [Kribbella sp.]HZX08678.1 hypothetical protein [Kribbella sp.]